MKKNLLLISLIILGLSIKAQVLDNTWYFSSTSKGLSFDQSNSSLSITNEHFPMPGSGGSGVAVDSITGNVMFYTNGCSIWDKSHQIMPNGNGLMGDSATIQNGLVCYYPNHPNQYFVFSNNGEAPNTGYGYYSIVDMTLIGNGDSLNPKGNVVSGFKNISFVDSTSEGMMIIQGNNNNFWLIVPRINSHDIRIFSITENGINLHSTYSLNTFLRYPECIRYSESTGRIAFASMQETDPVVIANFNINTGEISNESTVPGTPFGTSTTCWHGVFDMDWSFDGSKLYLSKYRDSSPITAGKIYQYDLNYPSIDPVVVYSIPSTEPVYSLRGMKRGPDNKIYFIYINTQYDNTRYIGVINNPDLQGSACNVNPTAINMGISLNNTHKFPEFLLPLHISIPELTSSISSSDATIHGVCDGVANVEVSGGTTPYSFIWNNGDTLSSLTGLCAGNYSVTITDANSNSVIANVTINEPTASHSLDYIWYFSTTSKGLYFDLDNNYVTVTNDHTPMIGSGGVGVAVDSLNGQVMFYTDGNKVWDKNHQQMINGFGLSGNNNTVQSGLVSYYPGHPNKYFIFSNNGESPNAGNAYYSIVDMTLQGNGTAQNPLGDIDVSIKNIQFADSTSEGMMIISGVSNNLWLIVPKYMTDELRLYTITQNGVQYVSSYHTGIISQLPVSVRYSNQSQKIAIGSMMETDPIVICDFDNITGTFSNSFAVPGTPFGASTTYWHGVFDFEWSADGTKLYISKYRDSDPVTSGKLYQYDLNNPTINPVVVYAIPSTQTAYMFKGLKRGPNNKIYFMYVNSTYSDSRYIGEINNPDLAGASCNINPTAINMGISLGNTHKFPEFLIPYQNSIVPEILSANINSTNIVCNSICNGSATISATGGTSPYTFLWSNGESTETISNLCAGTYSVTVLDNLNDSIVQYVTITEPSELILTVADIQGVGCNGENNGSATVLAFGGVTPYTFIWDGLPDINSQTVNTLTSGNYTVVVVDNNGCIATTSVEIPALGFATITGTVQFHLGYVGAGDGVVHLYKANVPGFYEVDSSAIYANGTFTLNHIPAGDYFLYVKMDNHANNPDYNTIYNTYYDSTFKWFDATILTMACEDSINLVINMYEKGNNSNGNGNITGNINYNSNNKAINGNPVTGTTITLEQNSDNTPIASTYSDINGYYEFINIPQGIYSIYVDVPGVPHQSTYTVSVTSTDTTFSNLNFVIDTTSSNLGIYGDSTVITNYISDNYSISVFPNPFIDNLTINYSIKKAGNVAFELIDIEGRVIESFNKNIDTGDYIYSFNELKNLKNGIYFLKVIIDNNVYINKLIKF